MSFYHHWRNDWLTTNTIDILRVGEWHCVSVCACYTNEKLLKISMHIHNSMMNWFRKEKNNNMKCVPKHMFSLYLSFLFILFLSLSIGDEVELDSVSEYSCYIWLWWFSMKSISSFCICSSHTHANTHTQTHKMMYKFCYRRKTLLWLSSLLLSLPSAG